MAEWKRQRSRLSRSRVTIKDVAREAAVSVGTASQAIHGNPVVRESTRRRVLAVAARLRYQPSAVARGLVTRRTHTIGLLISDIGSPFFIKPVRAVEDLAQENGYNVILCNTDEDPAKEMEYLRVLIEKRVDGMIVATTGKTVPAIRDAQWRGIPLVLFDQELPGLANDTVKMDGVAGSRLATHHLLELGHRRIAIIHGPLERSTGVERLDGYLAALRAARMKPVPELIREGSFKQDSGYRLTKELLRLSPPPTGLFCTNNLMTAGALLALREENVRIPHDLSFIGYDDMEWWTLTNPPLTIVAQPVYDLGREAMRLLLDRMHSGKRRPPERVVLKPELIVRESCGPPRRNRPFPAGRPDPSRERALSRVTRQPARSHSKRDRDRGHS